MDQAQGLPLAEITNLLGEFLEVAITLLLFVRGVYPPEVFELRRYLNVPVQWARHPELRQYINSAVKSSLPLIQKGAVDKLGVVFVDKNKKLLEKFTFQLRVDQHFNGKFSATDTGYALRAFFLRLSASEFLLHPLPPESTWEIHLASKIPPEEAKQEWHAWIPAEISPWEQPMVMTPIKSMNSWPLDVQLNAEYPSA